MVEHRLPDFHPTLKKNCCMLSSHGLKNCVTLVDFFAAATFSSCFFGGTKCNITVPAGT